MFDVLVESKPQKRGRGGIFGTGVGSVVFHGLLIYAGIILTAGAAEVMQEAPPETTLVYLEEPKEQPEEEKPPEPVVASLNPPPKGFQVLAAPIDIPKEIPPINLEQRFDPRDYTGVGVEGGIFSGVEGGTGPVDLTQVFAEAVVDETPERISCPLAEYPRMLQQAGVEGAVTLQFVVGTDGKVERGSVDVVRSDHTAFTAAARDMVNRCLFRPGRVRGQAVRVLVHMPINFTLQRRP